MNKLLANPSPSPEASGYLTQAHAQILKDHYGLDISHPLMDGLLKEGLIYSANAEGIRLLLGRQDVDSGGIVVIYPNARDCLTIRLDKPILDRETGKSQKYLRPKGSANRIYVPPGINLNQTPSIIITEGEFKALAGALVGMQVVALAGVWNFRGPVKTGQVAAQKLLADASGQVVIDEDALIPDLDFDWSGKKVVLMYDSDIGRQHTAWLAFPRLAEQLYRMGAERVTVYTLPATTEDSKTGLDDWLIKARKDGIPDDAMVQALNSNIDHCSAWLPTKVGASPFAEKISQKQSPTIDEKVLATAAILMSRGESAANQLAGRFGRGKVALLKDAKKLSRDRMKQQSPVAQRSYALDTLQSEIQGIIMANSDSDRPMPKELLKDEVYKVAQEAFELEGKFYVSSLSDTEVWWFHNDKKKLLSIGDIGFKTLFTNTSGLPVGGEYGHHVYDRLFAYAYQTGCKVTVHRMSYYDSESGNLYLDMFGGSMVRLDGAVPEIVPVGTDEVLFTSDESSCSPWQLVKPMSEDEELFEQVAVGANFRTDTSLSPTNAKLAVLAWRLAGFFREIQPTRACLLLKGEKGSGKTSFARYWLKMIMGPMADVVAIDSDNIDQFVTLITNEPMVSIDNLDGTVKKIEDILATAATGGAIPKRVLYLTNKLVKYPIQAWFTITTRTPHFRRDDIAERMIITELVPFVVKVSEGQLLVGIKESRDALMSVLVGVLNDMVAYLRDFGLPKEGETFRMADYAGFLRAYLRFSFGQTKGDTLADQVLAELGSAQSEFVIAEDSLLELIDQLLDNNRLIQGKAYRLSELLELLRTEAKIRQLKFPTSSTRTLAAMLRERSKAARDTGGLDIIVSTLHGNSVVRIKRIGGTEGIGDTEHIEHIDGG